MSDRIEPPSDIVDRLRHLAVDYSQNEHLPDSEWITEAADLIDQLRAALDPDAPCPHCGWRVDDEPYRPPGFDWETWTDPQFMYAASAVLASAMLWNVQHEDEWSEDVWTPHERALHLACKLMSQYLIPDE